MSGARALLVAGLAGVAVAAAPPALVVGLAMVATLAALRTIVGSGRVLAPMLPVVSVNLVYGGSLVCLAAYARVRLASGESGLGVLTAALGVGALAGVFLANPLARTRRSMRAILASALLAGLPIALLAAIDQPAEVAGLLVVTGAAGIVTVVLAVTMLQRSRPSAVTARGFGALDAWVTGAVLVGAALMRPMMQLLGLETAVVVIGLFVPAMLGAWAWSLHHPQPGLRPVLTAEATAETL